MNKCLGGTWNHLETISRKLGGVPQKKIPWGREGGEEQGGQDQDQNLGTRHALRKARGGISYCLSMPDVFHILCTDYVKNLVLMQQFHSKLSHKLNIL